MSDARDEVEAVLGRLPTLGRAVTVHLSTEEVAQLGDLSGERAFSRLLDLVGRDAAEEILSAASVTYRVAEGAISRRVT